MRILPLAALLVAASAASSSAAAPPAPAQEDPLVLRINPFRKGIDDWERTGSEKAIVFSALESTLTFKGQSGKEVPRLLLPKSSLDRFTLTMQVKSGTRKVGLVLLPAPDGEPVRLEIPRNAVKSGKWGDLSLKVGPGKAELLVPDGEGEKAVASADLPAGRTFRTGFEAPSGADGAVSNLKLVRRYENDPQICEEGFESTFPGDALGAWAPARMEMSHMFRAENGILIGEVRTEDVGWLALGNRSYMAYELRMRALWPTTHLEIRALETPGPGGQINRLDSVHVNLTDQLDPDGTSDIVVRLAEGTCTITVNGKKVMDGKVKPDHQATIISLFIGKGKRAYLRDLRIRDLDPSAGGAGVGRAAPPPPKAEEKPAAPPKPGWRATGGFVEKDGAWTVEEAEQAGAGLLLGASPASYELTFKVGRGAEGLTVVPRANRGIARASGIRLAEALFEKEEWTEVVVRMNLLTCTVSIAGERVGSLEVEESVGPPGFRVSGLGKAALKDLEFTPLK